ncbi:MAG: nitroreductase [Clostridiales bacterium]|jgi:nitroreductase|nr:nitroreductase [Clostridiales bacterium]
MEKYTADDFRESIRALESAISKCEKAKIKLKDGSPQKKWVNRQLEAFYVALAFIKKSKKKYVREECAAALGTLELSIQKCKKMLTRFIEPGSHKTLLERRRKAFEIAVELIKREAEMNDTLKTIATRYSCRGYTDEEVGDADLAAIAEAGLQAPSGMNRQNWHIVVVKNKALIAEMESEGMRVLSEFPDKAIYNRIMSRGGKLFYNASRVALIAVKEAFPKGAELIDLGAVAQNMALAATSLGVDNCYCGLAVFCFAGSKADEFRRKLKFPEGYGCGLGVLLGYAKEPSAPHAPDKEKVTVIE